MQRLIILFITASLLYAQDVRNIEKPVFSGPGVGLGATVTAASLDSVYSKILQYNYQYMLFAGLEDAEKRMADRVDWEFHAGVGAYEPEQMYKVGYIGCKMNFKNGKIVGAKALQSQLSKLRYYHSLAGLRTPIADSILARIVDINKQLTQYNSQFWYKRMGLAFWVPLYGEYNTTLDRSRSGNDNSSSYSELSVADSNFIAERQENFNAGSSRFLFQDFSKSAVALTYDLGDLITLSLGATLQRKMFIGVSVDISTPVTDFATTFRSELKTLRTPSSVNLGG